MKNGKELFKGQPDICNDHLNPTMAREKAIMELFGFPTACPLPAGQVCVDGSKKYDISKYKNLLPMSVGIITTHYDVVHDTVIIPFLFMLFNI